MNIQEFNWLMENLKEGDVLTFREMKQEGIVSHLFLCKRFIEGFQPRLADVILSLEKGPRSFVVVEIGKHPLVNKAIVILDSNTFQEYLITERLINHYNSNSCVFSLNGKDLIMDSNEH